MSSAEIDFRSSGEAKALLTRPAIFRRGRGWLAAYLALKILGTVVVTGVFASAVEIWTIATWITLGLVAVGALWIAGGAATAMLGFVQSDRSTAPVPDVWQPLRKTAILVLLCGEPAEPLAAYLRTLRRRADAMGLADTVSIFVLSDTHGARRIAAEEAALASLVDQESIVYRRRSANTGLKPGNIAEWVNGAGEAFSFMVVLDSDSRMSAERIRSLIFRMEQRPDLGLLQAGISMVLGRTLFGRHQRLANRLLSPNFGRGLAAWSGDVGNYWGHNAIMRIPAFRSALALPVLSRRAPFGGPPLSHDFVEAAWIRRAGWAVALDPEQRGSAEDGPQTLGEFYRRDRRWCQGNLQHLRIIGEPRLDPVSRLHLASGIAGYLVAPAWFLLLLIIAADLVTVRGALPLAAVAIILLLPKLLAFADFARRARTARRIRVILRASLSEVGMSALLAPLVMVRQCGAVLSVIMGRDCGWKSDHSSRLAIFPWLPEVIIGAAFLALGVASAATSVVWLLPVALPLLGAPVLRRWLEKDV
ncbi:MAG: glucans biosynthesis glucosyltransferase MdoH [Pseudomonadota bacterium]